MATTQSPNTTTSQSPTTKELPKLTPTEFKVWNRLAEHMNGFHNHFRNQWNLLYNAAVSRSLPGGYRISDLTSVGLSFTSSLTTHHDIEERFVFPYLAKRMPEFKSGEGMGAAELLRQHRVIHAGLSKLEEYLKAVRSGKEKFDFETLKSKMDSWGTVLWTHLDQEVVTLGAENVRKYWTLEEMKQMPGCFWK